MEGDNNQWNFGEGAGYYIDTTESKWLENYQMFSYVNDEFYELIISNFNVDINRIGIFGHSMGGHDALISFFKLSAQYKSVFAFAPICSASQCEWNEDLWKQYDACKLVSSYHGPLSYAPVLIDQGSDDKYKDNYLFPQKLIDACANASFPIQLCEQVGYEHDYYLIMTCLEDHFKYHKKEFEHLN